MLLLNVLCPQNQYEEYKVLISPNVQVKYDIPENEFLELLNSSQLVVMPLDTEAPAGLIALFQAGNIWKDGNYNGYSYN